MNTLSEIIALLPPGTAQAAGTTVAAFLTLAILSYVFGENPVFRVAEHLFVGLAAGYAGAIAWNHALLPRIRLLAGDPYTYWYYGVFMVLGAMLLARGLRPLASLGELPLAILFGVGAALALGGALSGTLLPQVGATVRSLAPAAYGGGLLGWAYALDALFLVLGTIASLAAFHYAAEGRGPFGALTQGAMRLLRRLGRKVIMVAFGALFAGAVLTFFTVLYSRIEFLLSDWLMLIGAGR